MGFRLWGKNEKIWRFASWDHLLLGLVLGLCLSLCLGLDLDPGHIYYSYIPPV